MQRYFLYAATVLVFPISMAAAGSERFVPGFDLQAARMILGHPTVSGACPAAPAPLIDMSGIVSRYVVGDPTQSRIDPARNAKDEAHTSGLTAFAKQLDHLSDQALRSNPPNIELQKCIMGELASWARAKAMEMNIDNNDRVGRDQAIMEQAWELAALASVVSKIGGFKAVPGDDANVVAAWMTRLAISITDNFSSIVSIIKPVSNHTYWAGYAVAATGVLVGNGTMLKFGRNILHQGLETVADDGSLPREMSRGSRAFYYQQFALLALAPLVALADSNDMPLNSTEEDALDRLITFNATRVDHLDLVEPLAHAKQEPAGAAFDLAWVDILLNHVKLTNPPLARMMNSLVSAPGKRPAWFIWLGGDVTATYNPSVAR